MKKVLILTYYWPPAAGPGVQRMLKFTKYLREFGWEPIVVTVNDGSYPSTDHSLEKDIPSRLVVKKTKTREPHRMYNALRGQKGKSVPVALMGMRDSKSIPKKVSLWIRANAFIPDARKGWGKFAFDAAVELIKEHDIKIVLTTGPPHSTHLTGLKLKQRLGVKHVADMRDPWTEVYTYKFMPFTDASKKKDKELEQKVLNGADAITVVSEGLKNMFNGPKRDIEVVYNGFDPSDIATKPKVDSSPHFVLGYVGNYKPNQNVSILWQVISELIQENPEFKNAFRFEVTGNMDRFIVQEIRDLGWGENLVLNGYVSHLEATAKMVASDVLLFVIPNDENNQLILTGKLFEYLGSGIEMASIGPVDGDASRIIEACGREQMVDYSDKESMKSKLKESFDRWSNKEASKVHDMGKVMAFSRESQTKKLAELLDKLHSQ